jgi:hypothetical protein
MPTQRAITKISLTWEKMTIPGVVPAERHGLCTPSQHKISGRPILALWSLARAAKQWQNLAIVRNCAKLARVNRKAGGVHDDGRDDRRP